MKLDKKGVPAEELRATMRQIASEDKQWKERLAAGVSYPAGDDVLEVAQQAYIDFFSVNALYPSIFPSTARFEREVIEMTAGLLHGERCGRRDLVRGHREQSSRCLVSPRPRQGSQARSHRA